MLKTGGSCNLVGPILSSKLTFALFLNIQFNKWVSLLIPSLDIWADW